MIELLFVVCMTTSPEQCKNQSMLYTDITPNQCTMGAQPELAKWVNQHPNWTIKKWECQTVDLTSQKT